MKNKLILIGLTTPILSILAIHLASGKCLSQTVEQTLKTNTMKNETMNMTITRTFNAPLERVWNAWSDSNLVKQWWGPAGFTAPLANIDFREEGVSLVCMRSPQGYDIYNTWTYKKIHPMNRIEFVQHFTDKNGKKLNPSEIGMPPGIPEEVPHVLTFKDMGNGKTELTIIEYGYTSAQIVEVSKTGMAQVLDKMESVLKTK